MNCNLFRFIHASELHLDSPLCGLDRYEGAPTDRIRGATRRALEKLVRLAIDEEVKFLSAQMSKLRRHGIPKGRAQYRAAPYQRHGSGRTCDLCALHARWPAREAVRLLGIGPHPCAVDASGAESPEDILLRVRTVVEGAYRQESHLAQLKNIPPATAILDLETPIVAFYKKLGGHSKAMTDLPKLQGEWAQTEDSAEGLVKDIRPGLPLADAEQARLSAGERERISLLIFPRPIHQGKNIRRTAREELSRVGETRNMAELRDAVRRIQKSGDLDEEWAKTKIEREQEETQTEVELKKLPLWTGTIEALEVLTVPPVETLDRFETDVADRRSREEAGRSFA